MTHVTAFHAVMSFEEIATKLGISVAEVRRANHRAIGKLRRRQKMFQEFRSLVLAQRDAIVQRQWMVEPKHSIQRR